MSNVQPYFVGIGGTARPGSSTENALRFSLRLIEGCGAKTRLFGGTELMQMPHYLGERSSTNSAALELLQELRQADGIIVASPGYHGTISGPVKNALDYTEEMATDVRPYFDGLPIGLIATAHGWQAACNTLAALRSIAHALRGWPTPIGVPINTATCSFLDDRCSDKSVTGQLEGMVRQMFKFTSRESRHKPAATNEASAAVL